jgi:hypothetical protein
MVAPAAAAAHAPVDVNSTQSGTAGAAAGVAGAPVATVGSSAPGTPSARLAALQGVTAVPSGKPTESDGPIPHLSTSLVGPGDIKVGDEFTVTLQMQTDQGVSKVRSQLRYDAAAFQLVSGDPGGLIPDSTGAKVVGRSGGAQIEATMPSGDTINGNGELMVLKFKAMQARAQASFSAQVTVMGASGAIMANSTPTPLTLAVAAQESAAQ